MNPGKSSERGKKASFRWTPELVSHFVEAIHYEVITKGTATENGMKKETWNSILRQINTKTPKNVKLEKDQIQSKYSELKAKYGTFQAIVDNSGFGWDAELEMPTAGENVWDTYIFSHPKAKEFRNKSLPNYGLLNEIFGGKIATGKYSSNGDSLTLGENDDEENDVDEYDATAEGRNYDDEEKLEEEEEANPPAAAGAGNVAVAGGKRPAPPAPALKTPLKTPVKTPASKKLKPIESAVQMLGKLIDHNTKSNVGSNEVNPNCSVERATKHFSEMFTHLPTVHRVLMKEHLRMKERAAELYLSYDDEEKEEYVSRVVNKELAERSSNY